MFRFAKNIRNAGWRNPLLLIFFFYFFRGNFREVWKIFTSPEFYENGIAFLALSAVFCVTVFKHRSVPPENRSLSPLPLVLLATLAAVSLFNDIVFHLSIMSPVVVILACYGLFGLYTETKFWQRGIFIFLLITATLPVLERIQKFLGFPVRLLTAKIVSGLLSVLGIGNITDSSVIISENHATSIDLPCSGVKSIYTGGLFMLATYYVRSLKISPKLFFLTVSFFLLLLIFNTWRVFSLVYIYDILELPEFGNTVHITLGISGFLISCYLLWIWSGTYTSREVKSGPAKTSARVAGRYLKNIAIVILGLGICIQTVFSGSEKTEIHTQAPTAKKVFDMPLNELEFTPAEKNYFDNFDISFSKKYSGFTKGGLDYSLLVVASKSARTHHDPEVCLTGLGNTIVDSQILQSGNLRIRKLSLNDNRDTAFYWYVGKNKNILDYSERVWEEIIHPGQTWVLVIAGFKNNVNLDNQDIRDVLGEINVRSKTLTTDN